MTKRQDILEQLKSMIETVYEVKYVEINRMTVLDLDTVPMPCVFIYSGREVRATDDESVIGFENWDWNIVVEVWANDMDLEDLLGKIHAAIYEDYTLGNLASYILRTGVDMLVVDPEKLLKAMLIDYQVKYRHQIGVM